MRLESHKKELADIASSVPGVKHAQAKIGPKYESPPIYGKSDFELPSKILLVDDEKEFVQTLSERLQARDMDSTVAYNGEEALEQIAKDEPEVIILDLKMPGIDGMEVLRKVKRERANVEVIILTGHGSEKDRALAEELGAFAYLEKPVDIDVLTKTMKAAYGKIHESKEGG
jgi:DNA-binding response OmpR family regulator